MTLLYVLVTVETILVMICLLALIDQHRVIQSLAAGANERESAEPITFERGPETAPQLLGIELDVVRQPEFVMLFLSTSCTTCAEIADGLEDNGEMHDRLLVVLQGHSESDVMGWMALRPMSLRGRVVVDADGGIANALGIHVAPAAVVYFDGVPVLAQTVPSRNQLDAVFNFHRLRKVVTSEMG